MASHFRWTVMTEMYDNTYIQLDATNEFTGLYYRAQIIYRNMRSCRSIATCKLLHHCVVPLCYGWWPHGRCSMKSSISPVHLQLGGVKKKQQKRHSCITITIDLEATPLFSFSCCDYSLRITSCCDIAQRSTQEYYSS